LRATGATLQSTGATREPCDEAETVQLLREIDEHARRGDADWLKRRGKVYEAVDAA
jgi:hypothetical protein